MAYAANTNYAPNTVAMPRVDSEYLRADDFLAQRDILAAVVENWDEKNLISMLELTDRAVAATDVYFWHYEDGQLYRTVGIATITSPTAASATITLTADSYTTVGSLSGNIARSPLKGGDVVMLAPGIHARVNRKSSPSPVTGQAFTGMFTDPDTPSGAATTYTLVRRNGDTTDLGALLETMRAGGLRMSIPYNAFAEGTYQPIENLKKTNTKYRGQMQIFKQHDAITRTADGIDMEIQYNGSRKVWNKMVPDMVWKHRADMNFAFAFSPGGTFTDDNQKTVRLTDSLESKTKQLGNIYNYTKASGFGLADLDAVVAKIKATGEDDEFWLEAGSTLANDFRKIIMTAVGGNGAIVYNNWGAGDPRQKAIDLGVNSVVYQGITFHIQEMKYFSFPNVTDLANFDYATKGFLIPFNRQKITFSDNGRQTQTRYISAATLRYLLQSDGTNSRVKQWDNRHENNGGKDEYSADILSEEGLQLTGLRKFQYIVGS